MTYFVYLNGPPKVGKDVIANLLAAKYENVVHVKFAQILRDAVCGIFGIDEEAFEADKDATDVLAHFDMAEWRPLTYREFVIRLAEVVLKPNFGEGCFGVSLAERISNDSHYSPRHCNPGLDTVYVVSDLGFRDELIEFRSRMPATDSLLIQLYRDGLNFDSDSRNYVSDVIMPVRVSTNGSIEQSLGEVESLMKDMLIHYSDSLRESE